MALGHLASQTELPSPCRASPPKKVSANFTASGLLARMGKALKLSNLPLKVRNVNGITESELDTGSIDVLEYGILPF